MRGFTEGASARRLESFPSLENKPAFQALRRMNHEFFSPGNHGPFNVTQVLVDFFFAYMDMLRNIQSRGRSLFQETYYLLTNRFLLIYTVHKSLADL
jgi:hypothetical protein